CVSIWAASSRCKATACFGVKSQEWSGAICIGKNPEAVRRFTARETAERRTRCHSIRLASQRGRRFRHDLPQRLGGALGLGSADVEMRARANLLRAGGMHQDAGLLQAGGDVLGVARGQIDAE